MLVSINQQVAGRLTPHRQLEMPMQKDRDVAIPIFHRCPAIEEREKIGRWIRSFVHVPFVHIEVGFAFLRAACLVV